jgi:hydrogenase-4 component B
VTLIGLSLIGGLAIACFTKAFGIVFLGEPRTAQTADVQESGISMRVSMAMLAAGCFAIGFLAPLVFRMLSPVITQVGHISPDTSTELISQVTGTLNIVTIASLIFCGLIIFIALFRFGLFKSKKVNQVVTWDCGYVLPTSRMQYTASSFAQPILDLFRTLMGPRRNPLQLNGVFPESAALHTDNPDIFQKYLFRPIFVGAQRALETFRWLQHGNVHLYILYILITMLVLLFWKLR